MEFYFSFLLVISLSCVPQRVAPDIYMRLISCSLVYFSRPESRLLHHSYSMDSQISLNQGVNFSVGSLNRALSSSCVTYLASRTSFGLRLRSTLALMNRM